MISLVAVAKNEERYIPDWVEWHKKHEFDQIVIFDNGGNGDLSKLGINVVDVKDMKAPQIPCYQDFINKMNIGDWALFCDIDEFLHCDKVHEYVSRFPNVDCIRLNWRVFGDCGQIHYDNRPIWQRNQLPSPKDCIYNDELPKGIFEPYHIKNFYHRTFKPAQANVHQTLVAGGVCTNAIGEIENGLVAFQPCDWNGAWLDHYMIKSTEEWCERRLNKIDATGNKIDNDKLIRWYFNLCARTKEKEDIINAYITGASKDLERVCVQSELKQNMEQTKTRRNWSR